MTSLHPGKTIICGACKGRHGTTVEVRECYASKFSPARSAQAPTTPQSPAPATNAEAAVRLQELLAVPEGRYAVEIAGVLKFYKIEHGKNNWKGRTFVKQLVANGVHLAEYKVYSPAAREQILREIARDPAAASATYGYKLGQCGVCGRTLTDKLSRDMGIGPVCRSKRGW